MSTLYKRSNGVFYVKRLLDDGRYGHRSLGTMKRAEARQLQKLIDIQWRNEKWGVPKAMDYSPEEALKLFEVWAASHLAPGTIDSYGRFFLELFDDTRVKTVGAVKPEHVEIWKRRLLGFGNAPSTINTKMRQVQTVYRWLIAHTELAGPNPFAGVKALKTVRGEVHFLSAPECERLIAAARAYGPDIHLAIMLMLYAGLRKNEMLHCRWEWVDWDRNLIRVQAVNLDGYTWTPKTVGSSGDTPLHPKLRAALFPIKVLEGYIVRPSKANESWRYRWEFKRDFDAVKLAAGLPHAHPHLLRHTIASHLAQAGMSLPQIGKVLRHSSVRSTEIYAHLQADGIDTSGVL